MPELPVSEPKKEAAKESFDSFPMVDESAIPSPPVSEDFDDFPLAEPSVEDKVRAVSQGAVSGLAKASPIIPGMMMGAGIGALAGPAAPVAVPLAAAVGAGAGFMFGQGLEDIASNINMPISGEPLARGAGEMDPALRPFGFAGEVIGGSVPFAGAPLAAAQSGARLPESFVGRYINKIVDFAAESPAVFALAEAGSAASSATAAGVAEAFLPGQSGARTTAEIAGGFLNPSRLFVTAGKGVMDGAKRAVQSFSQAGRETRAAKVLQEMLEDAGEDPALLAQLLRESDIPGVRTTSGQKTGSPTLLAIESRLASESAKFGSESQKMAEDTLDTLQNMIVVLRGTGDPAALAMAADLRGRYFRTLLAGRVQSAEREAVEAAQRISGDTPRARSELSTAVSEIADDALRQARKAEGELWDLVPRETPANAGTVIGQFDNLRTGMLPEETLPVVVEGFVDRMRQSQGNTTAGELLLFRSRALALGRDAAKQGKANEARIFGTLAEAALDDLSIIGARTGGAVDDARAFSRELNDTFTRTFAGKVTGNRMPPELTMRKAFGTGKEAGDLQLQELEEATRFMTTRTGDPENLNLMLDAQERIVRLAAADAIDPNTGRISAARLGKFVRDNEGLLDRFPEIRTDLNAAVQSEQALRGMQRLSTGASRAIDKQAAFSKLAKVENPVDAVSRAVSGPSPVKDLGSFIKLARRTRDATEGLKASVWDHAARQASDSRGGFSFERFREAMFEPVRPGKPSLAQIMHSGGVITTSEMNQTRRLLSEARKIESAIKTGRSIDELVENPSALFEFIVSVAGARLGAAGAGGSTGAPLIAAGRGAQFMRNIAGRVPVRRIKDVLIEAALNPKFAAALLKKPKTTTEGIRLARQINAFLLQAGIPGEESEPQ